MLNIVVENYVGIGLPLKVEAKEEKLLKSDKEDSIDGRQSPRTGNLEDNHNKEGLLTVFAKHEGSEDCVEFLGGIPSEMIGCAMS